MDHMTQLSQESACGENLYSAPTYSANANTATSRSPHQPGAVFSRAIPSPEKCQAALVMERDSGLGMTIAPMSDYIDQTLRSSHSSTCSISRSYEGSCITVMERPPISHENVTDEQTGQQPDCSQGPQSVTGQQPLGSQRIQVDQHPMTSHSVTEHSHLTGSCSYTAERAEKRQNSALSSLTDKRDSTRPADAQNYTGTPPTPSSLKYPVQVASALVRGSSSCSDDQRGDFSRSISNEEPTEDDLNAIEIKPEEFREDFKEDQYDIVLIYSEKDRDQALAFREILMNFVTLRGDKHPSICVLDQNTNLTYITSRFAHMEEALRRSTYMFLFLTKDFCVDSWAQLQRDECLMESIHNPEKKWCVVPILTKSRKEADYQMPFGLRALKGVEISHMLRGKTLDSVEVSSLEAKDIDPYFLKNMTKMLNDRIYLKEERKKKQLTEFQEWYKDEQLQRWKQMQKDKLSKEMADKRRALEMQRFREEFGHKKQEQLEMLDRQRMAAGDDGKSSSQSEPYRSNMQEQFNRKGFPGAVSTEPAVYHFHAPVTEAPKKQIIYHIYGPVSGSTFGNNNTIVKEDRSHVTLDDTNLETDALDSQEYVVVTEQDSTGQDDHPETTPGLMSSPAAQQGFVGPSTMAPCDAMMVDSEGKTGKQRCSPSSSYPVIYAKNEATPGEQVSSQREQCVPDVDRPTSPPIVSSTFNMPAATDGKKNSFKMDASSSLEGSGEAATNVNFQPVRPMASVAPIRFSPFSDTSCEEEETVPKFAANSNTSPKNLHSLDHEETLVKQIAPMCISGNSPSPVKKTEEAFEIISSPDQTTSARQIMQNTSVEIADRSRSLSKPVSNTFDMDGPSASGLKSTTSVPSSLEESQESAACVSFVVLERAAVVGQRNSERVENAHEKESSVDRDMHKETSTDQRSYSSNTATQGYQKQEKDKSKCSVS